MIHVTIVICFVSITHVCALCVDVHLQRIIMDALCYRHFTHSGPCVSHYCVDEDYGLWIMYGGLTHTLGIVPTWMEHL